jgi:hypothetical protein
VAGAALVPLSAAKIKSETWCPWRSGGRSMPAPDHLLEIVVQLGTPMTTLLDH